MCLMFVLVNLEGYGRDFEGLVCGFGILGGLGGVWAWFMVCGVLG